MFSPIRFLLFFTLLALSACAGDATDESLGKTSSPAPGVAPTPAVASSGTLSAGKLMGFPSTKIEGCDCSLRLDPTPEGGTAEDLFFVFNRETSGPGVIGIGGKEYVVERGASLGTGGNNKYVSYLHQNGTFSIQTSLTEEGAVGDEGSSYSGKVKVKNLKTEEEMVVNVTGTCSC